MTLDELKFTREESSGEAAIASTDSPYQVCRVLGTLTAAVCTDTPIPRTAAGSTRPSPISH